MIMARIAAHAFGEVGFVGGDAPECGRDPLDAGFGRHRERVGLDAVVRPGPHPRVDPHRAQGLELGGELGCDAGGRDQAEDRCGACTALLAKLGTRWPTSVAPEQVCIFASHASHLGVAVGLPIRPGGSATFTTVLRLAVGLHSQVAVFRFGRRHHEFNLHLVGMPSGLGIGVPGSVWPGRPPSLGLRNSIEKDSIPKVENSWSAPTVVPPWLVAWLWATKR